VHIVSLVNKGVTDTLLYRKRTKIFKGQVADIPAQIAKRSTIVKKKIRIFKLVLCNNKIPLDFRENIRHDFVIVRQLVDQQLFLVIVNDIQ